MLCRQNLPYIKLTSNQCHTSPQKEYMFHHRSHFLVLIIGIWIYIIFKKNMETHLLFVFHLTLQNGMLECRRNLWAFSFACLVLSCHICHILWLILLNVVRLICIGKIVTCQPLNFYKMLISVLLLIAFWQDLEWTCNLSHPCTEKLIPDDVHRYNLQPCGQQQIPSPTI